MSNAELIEQVKKIAYLPEKTRAEAWYKVFEATKDPLVLRGLVNAINYLPEKERKEAWYAIIGVSENRILPYILLYELDCLPEKIRVDIKKVLEERMKGN